jgi:hypothetical protein
LFVVTKLRFGADGQGMNLDCVETPGQCRDDVCRDGPDDGPSGVDNRLGPLALKLSTLVGSDLQAEMAKQIEAGRHPLLVRVTGATDWRDGGGTAVELSFGLDVDDDPSDLASGQGRVRYDPEPASRPSRFVPVGLAGGVLRAGPTTDWMPLFWTRGQIAAVPVQRAFLKGMVETPPRGEPALAGRLVSGMIAGAVHATHLAQAILDMDARTARVLRGLAPVVRALVRQQADLDLVPAGLTDRPCRENGDCLSGQRCQAQRCHEPLHHYDSISFALLFEAVSAQAVHPPAS